MSDIKLSSLFGITGYPMISGQSNVTSISSSTFTAFTTYASPLANSFGWLNTTTGRFTPQVAGYYQINGSADYSFSSFTATVVGALIYKNGSLIVRSYAGASPAAPIICVSGIVFLNGSSDYVQIYTYQNSGSTYSNCYGQFSAVLVSNQ